MRRTLLVVILGLVSAFGCNDGERESTPRRGDENGSVGSGRECPAEPPPFRPTYLPSAISGELRPGAGGGGATDRPAWFHYAGPPGRFIDVLRGQSPFRQTPEDVEPVRVLGREGTLGGIHEGESVEFSLGASCDRFALLGYGLSKQEMRRFAEGLAPR